jgi:hypothetical protein
MKTCNVCNQEKPLTDFHRKGNRYQSMCKSCRVSYHRAHYLANKQKYMDKAAVLTKQLRQEVQDVKVSAGCLWCGEKEPCCLEFHHRDSADKDLEVSRLVSRGNRAKLFAEIAKCDVLCANCHKKLHAGVLCGHSVNGNTSGFHPEDLGVRIPLPIPITF